MLSCPTSPSRHAMHPTSAGALPYPDQGTKVVECQGPLCLDIRLVDTSSLESRWRKKVFVNNNRRRLRQVQQQRRPRDVQRPMAGERENVGQSERHTLTPPICATVSSPCITANVDELTPPNTAASKMRHGTWRFRCRRCWKQKVLLDRPIHADLRLSEMLAVRTRAFSQTYGCKSAI
jgi:hypothetical protein